MTTTRKHSDPLPAAITIAGRTYDIDPVGYCEALHAWVTRNNRGELVTIPDGDDD